MRLAEVCHRQLRPDCSIQAYVLTLVIAIFASSPLWAQSPSPLALPDARLLRGGTVQHIAVLPDGSRVVAGFFSSVNVVARTNLAKIRADGTVDTGWIPPALGDIRSVAGDAQGNVYVVEFLDGTRSRIVKLSAEDGSPVAAFAASAPYIGQVTVHGDALYTTGGWPLAGGGNRIARLSLASGAIDTTYVPEVQLTFAGFEVDPQGRVYVVTSGALRRVLPDGRLDLSWNVASSSFIVALGIGDSRLYVATQAPSTSDPNPVLGFSLANGAVDTTWNATTTGRVRVIEADSQGSIWLGGDFTRVNGVDIRYLARLDQNGVLVPAGNAAPSSFVYALEESGNGMAVGGVFERLGTQTRLAVARLGLDGSLLPDSTSVERSASSTAFARQPNGGMIVGGDFAKVGHYFTSGAARFHADGTLDTTWRSDVPVRVSAVAVDSSGAVFLGAISGIPAGVAKLRGDTGATITDWSPALTCAVDSLSISTDGWLHVGAVVCSGSGASRLRRVRSDSGTVDATWPANSTLNVSVRSIVDDGQGSLYVAFGSSVAKVAAATGQTTWRLRTGSGSLTELALSGGDVFVGGGFCGLGPFDQAPTPATSPCFVARVAGSNGAVNSSWAASSVPGRVFSLAATASGELVVGGFDFETDDPFDLRGVPFLKKVRSSDGSAITDWDPRPNDTPSALLADSPDRVWVGGPFTRIGGLPRGGIALLPLAGAPQLPASNILFDPRRDGHGIEFVRVRDSLYALTFYTYGADGQPEWYQALGNVVNGVFAPTPDANGKSLFRYRYVPGASPPQQQVPALSGTVAVDFNAPATSAPCNDGRDASHAVAVMKFSLGADQNVRWCMQPIVAATARPFLDFSGLWFAGPADDGWGWSVLNFRLTSTNGVTDGVAALLFYYDGAGNSSFAFAQAPSFINGEALPVFHRRGYCRTCPTVPFVDSPAGSATFTFTQPSESASANNRVTYSVTPQNAVGGTFARTNSPFVLLTSPQ